MQRWGDEYEILCGLGQDSWGQGIAGEASRACMRYAFEVAGLERIVAAIHPDNHASHCILTRKLGMRDAPQMDFYGECPHFIIQRQDHSPEDEPLLNLSTDPARLDIDTIARFLSQSYWADTRRRETIERSIQGSLNFGIYDRCKQIGYARIISDCATLAWLCDVFIDETYRGHGLGKWLVSATLAHPDLQGMRRFLLATRDAHGLYSQFGYAPLKSPERWMEKFNPDAT
jgi:RimJ/RimL family protein N-acetyltransferase